MNLSDFDYTLPDELIAQFPLKSRDKSRLLVLDSQNKTIDEIKFFDISKHLGQNDVLVLNETRVINARLKGKMEIFPKGVKKIKDIEILLHKQISLDTWECLGPGNNLKIGRIISFYNNSGELVLEGKVLKVSNMGRYIVFDKSSIELMSIIDMIGEQPLPPYISQTLDDKERYQTVFGKVEGSAAAPTAGLHFTEELINLLIEKGVKIEKVLLHVGVGTFKPVETDKIEDHYMHHEYIEINKETAEKLNKYKNEGKNIIAVGTTCVRTLESFANDNGEITCGNKETNIFIYPGYKWKFVDSIITNFHLPKSTLLMLVSSFAGREFIMKAYNYSIENKFRFFSFGDAMWIKNKTK